MTDQPPIFSQKLKVLVIEDNAVDRKVLQSMMAEALPNPEDVEYADSLETACKIFDKTLIDVVILDLNLPDSQGLETLIKLNRKYPDVAVVVNTGAYEDDLGLKTMGLGAQDFIVKGKYKAYTLNKAVYYAKERKRFELELVAAYKRLQEAQANLIEAEKMNVVGRLASGIAHEVKNPLATILFGVAYLNERIDAADEKIRMTLTSIKEASNRANDIITDLLDFAGLARLNKRSENINRLIEKALSLTAHQLEKQAVKVVKNFDIRIPDVNVDDNRIEQVLVNLILNAVYAMPLGGELTVKTSHAVLDTASEHLRDYKGKEILAGTSVVLVEIEDAGTGIPKEMMDKIFDPFFTTRRTKGGVGLGLSVSRNIIEMHDGAMWVENRKEGGVRSGILLKAEKETEWREEKY